MPNLMPSTVPVFEIHTPQIFYDLINKYKYNFIDQV